MPAIKKVCRVCGCEYEACRSLKKTVGGPFQWQEVACSPECGAEYLRRVNEARNPVPKSKRGNRAKVVLVDEVSAPVKEQVDTVIEAVTVEHESPANTEAE